MTFYRSKTSLLFIIVIFVSGISSAIGAKPKTSSEVIQEFSNLKRQMVENNLKIARLETQLASQNFQIHQQPEVKN